jgi:hypothetical protein
MAQTKRRPVDDAKPIETGDLIAWHTAQFADGWVFCLTNSVQSPTDLRGVSLYGPYATEAEATTAASQAAQDRLRYRLD